MMEAKHFSCWHPPQICFRDGGRIGVKSRYRDRKKTKRTADEIEGLKPTLSQPLFFLFLTLAPKT